MADERIQELLRELRERWGLDLVPRPSAARLVAFRELASSGFNTRATELLGWLLEIGEPVGRPLRHGIRCGVVHGRSRCEKEAGHEGGHSCHSPIPAPEPAPPQPPLDDVCPDCGSPRQYNLDGSRACAAGCHWERAYGEGAF